MHEAKTGPKNQKRAPNITHIQHLQQQHLLQYIADACARLHGEEQAEQLFHQILTILQQMPGFFHCALYLDDKQSCYQYSSRSTTESDRTSDLQEYHLSVAFINHLQYIATKIHNIFSVPLTSTHSQHGSLSDLLTFFMTAHDTQPLAYSLTQQVDSFSRQMLMLPIMGEKNTRLGFLFCVYPQYDRTTTLANIPVLTLFTQQVGLLLEKTHFKKELLLAHEERLAMLAVGSILTSPEALKDVKLVYQVIYEQVKRLMPVDFFLINHYDVENDELTKVFLVQDGITMAPPEDTFVHPSIKPFLWQENSSIIFDDRQSLETFLSQEMAPLFRLYQNRPDRQILRSKLYMVIRYGKEPIGMLAVESYQEHSYQQEHVEMLKEIGFQAAAALKCAQMYKQSRIALEQLQESERLKNHFLMTASHELRTPLTAIQGYLELLNEFGDTLSNDVKSRFIDHARRASEELVLIVGTIMDASRLEQDKVDLKPTTISLKAALQTILEILHPIIVKEERRIITDVSSKYSVWVDDLRLRQVLLNIINNALKYTPAGTDIEITAHSTTSQELYEHFPVLHRLNKLKPHTQYVVVKVRDWGPGIALQDQLYLFTKFMRLSSSMNSMQRGAGLGLYLCRQLVEAMGGSVWLESSGIEGEGCSFFIALPVEP